MSSGCAVDAAAPATSNDFQMQNPIATDLILFFSVMPLLLRQLYHCRCRYDE